MGLLAVGEALKILASDQHTPSDAPRLQRFFSNEVINFAHANVQAVGGTRFLRTAAALALALLRLESFIFSPLTHCRAPRTMLPVRTGGCKGENDYLIISMAKNWIKTS
jgi:hypothetical protein